MKQISFGFKKEWLQFLRTFRFGGTIIAILSFAVSGPLMFRMMATMMTMMGELAGEVEELGESYGQMMGEMSGLYNDAGMVFAMTLADLCATSLLVVMLILMSPAGGEQKKRATIIPTASGLDYYNYLVPKFVMYPSVTFVLTFLSAVLAGGLCNALFDANHIPGGMILLAALLAAIYGAFTISVYLAIGLCSSHPAIATLSVYLGSSIIVMLLQGFGLEKYNPFTLRILITGSMFSESFVLSENVASISVGCVLSLVIAALMFFMTYAVLNAKKIDNQRSEDTPEF